MGSVFGSLDDIVSLGTRLWDEEEDRDPSVATEGPVATVIPVLPAFGVAFLSRPVNASRLLSAFWSSDACHSGRHGRLTCWVVAASRWDAFWLRWKGLPPSLSPAVELGGAAGGSCGAEVAPWERGGDGELVVKAPWGVCSVWGTPECSISAVCLPADVATTEHVSTSEKESPWLDVTLSQRRSCSVVSALRVLSGCLVQTPDCCFGNPFLGTVRGGTVGCSSLTSWRVRGAGCFCLWALDLVEVFASALCSDFAGSAGVVFGLTRVVVEAFLCSAALWFSAVALFARLTSLLSSDRDSVLQEFVVFGSIGGGTTFQGLLAGVQEVGLLQWRVLLLLLGARAASVVAIFARAAVGFILGLHVHVGVSRRLKEPACGVAFTGAGPLPVDPVEVGVVLLEFFSVGSGGELFAVVLVGVPLPLGLLLCSLKSFAVLPLWLSCCATSGLRYAAIVLAVAF
ncbi:hypothetical protein Taro_024144 [Colocasia esculenta]|uniref:Uncharacterized protein n=1 Tax=Colocasia esculenta TaxID=4460 RepID=A0A843VCV8_COLES|nr:hypothetical protein [Colocasia esculenta]